MALATRLLVNIYMVDLVELDRTRLLGQGNMRLVRQLFIENDQSEGKHLAVYSIGKLDREVNGKIYPSLYRLYIEEDDITEARFVEKYLYDWDQWNSIVSSAMYKEEIARWRRELKNRTMGKLVDTLKQDAFSKSKSASSSAKYLLDRFGLKPVGRPSKANRISDEETRNNIAKDLQEDSDRLFKVVGKSDTTDRSVVNE